MLIINNIGHWLKNAWYFLVSFFPVQLLLLHLRRSHLLIIFWLILFLFVSGNLGSDYGFQYLFLSPEYLGEVSFLSYFFVGVNAGLFTMAFHLSSYIYYSYRYPFLATLNRPLFKFCINNSAIPIAFFALYLVHVASLLKANGYGHSFVLIAFAGLLSGAILSIVFAFAYFFNTIKSKPQEPTNKTERALRNLVKKGTKVPTPSNPKGVVNYYLKNFYTVKVTRSVKHYDFNILLQTIQQHHFTASVYFIVLICIVVILNLLSDYTVFKIPAGASVFLIFSLYLMITGALYSRLKTWTVTIGMSALLVLNYLSGFEQFARNHYAYGMDYKAEPASYSYETLHKLTTDSVVEADLQSAKATLNKWKAKQSSAKPKLILLNVSGGGLRSSLWTMRVLQTLDSTLGDKFYKHIHLISGSSGGMLGASYYRSLQYYQTIDSLTQPNSFTHYNNMGADLLNPVAYSLAVNDLFLRFRRYTYQGKSYLIDRGKAFDDKLVENTEGFLAGGFNRWATQEARAEIPTLLLAPTIIGDGRKLLMSTQGLSFLTYSIPFTGLNVEKEFDAVEYKRLFAHQDYEDLRFATALRMSASFPYITPLVNLPSKPGIELIDAGARDNEGFEIALRYVLKMQDWIAENTSGVVFVQIKANRPDEIPIEDPPNTNLDQLTKPIGGIVESFHNLQIYNKALLMELVEKNPHVPMDVVRFSLFETTDDLSLSWHLTEGEKRYVKRAVESRKNKAAMKSLAKLLN